MRHTTLLASIMLAVSTTAAFAAALAPASVTLVTPVATPNTAVIALNTGWNCTGNTCTARLDRKSPAVRDCRQIARVVGPISGFSVAGKNLDAAGIAACNAPAR